ncbi:class I histocompatibility antigen, F10 alpha chain-like [Parambassis ranga]|uniref:Class I histocompatibility antigen, F10 alpha chain-like n=1 Tax=Parambassis ranga TaxID=210632 RepID=A0A6P7I0S9_9TELE|nr:class I histocompatibility antigen, F10 alpha chain-like [Parambassis ranga]XP_028256388.1 class I histocompatibility antigen, F10 alpha chain-like [Parambassis ranga]XP_028256389.1 class I histocompatibility antigen, F10 alpha chain-like [Parambassis ranga]
MKEVLFVLLLGIHAAAPVTHSMTYIVTGVSGINGFPEHNEVGLVDGEEFVHYDSHLKKVIPKTAWIEKYVNAEEAGYWDKETQRNINTEQVFKGNIGTVMQRFNQTGGAHVNQVMYGCEWDDETGEVNGYEQHGYDGEDFLSFDLKTETWIAPRQQAELTKNKWDNDRAWIAQKKNYLTQICPEWVKKYVNYGRSSLMRTVLPSVSFLQKTPSSPISCHVTGFYPNRAELVWRKDGEEIHEGVDKGEILPNHDGTFQMSVEMDFSSVPEEERKKYECVFQLSGVKEDVVTRLDRTRSNNDPGSGFPAGPVVGGVVGLLVLAACVAGIVYFLKKPNKGFKRASTSESSSSSTEEAEKKGPV